MRHRISSAGRARIAVLSTGLWLGGCAHYVTPGGPADFRALGISDTDAAGLTDASIAAALDKRPLASFPATIAVVRVQDRDYSSYSYNSYGSGRFSTVSVREAEDERQAERLAAMPMVAGVVLLNRLALPGAINEQIDLRQGAASVHADMTLLYTFDTKFGVETTIPALGVITLGLFPNEQARVTCTASAALLDTRNGYVYALAEATAKEDQIANGWTSRDAVEQSRRRAEREALKGLVDEVERSWSGVVDRYASAR